MPSQHLIPYDQTGEHPSLRQLTQHDGILKVTIDVDHLRAQGDQLTDRFLRILTELAVTHCLSSETAPAPARGVAYNFAAIDAYVRLLTTLINAHGGGPLLLAKALTILCTGAAAFYLSLPRLAVHKLVVEEYDHRRCKTSTGSTGSATYRHRAPCDLADRAQLVGDASARDVPQTIFAGPILICIRMPTRAVLQRDFDERLGDFSARPYFRAFVGFICELEPPEPVGAAQFGHLQALAAALAQLTPQRVPGFVFSWLELISHRC